MDVSPTEKGRFGLHNECILRNTEKKDKQTGDVAVRLAPKKSGSVQI